MSNQYLDRLNTGITTLAKTNPSFVRNMINLSEEAAKDGVLNRKTKKLIFVALAISQRCEFCIAHHVYDALEAGANKEEILEAGQVAVAMGGGPNLAYLSTVLQDVLTSFEQKNV
ncbi:MAG TPA: carboxymuconolactone decarboxylase family protein [Desulfohalobiaceae bacterium]|nr:carboxymuconolactone decarboxylase family protein [Desulfohalobiaceae bacterium]